MAAILGLNIEAVYKNLGSAILSSWRRTFEQIGTSEATKSRSTLKCWHETEEQG